VASAGPIAPSWSKSSYILRRKDVIASMTSSVAIFTHTPCGFNDLLLKSYGPICGAIGGRQSWPLKFSKNASAT